MAGAPPRRSVGSMATRTTAHDMETARDALLDGSGVERRRLEAAGVATTVLEGGSGAPVVRLHGPAGNAAHWLRVLPELTRTHRVVAPDLPGHGATGPADDVVSWLRALIEQTCDAPAALVGHALGAAIAARYAAAPGTRVERLVLVDPLGLAPFAPEPEFAAALEAFLTDPGERTHDALWAHCAHDLPRLRAALGARWAPFRAGNVTNARTPAAVHDLMERFGLAPIPVHERERITAPTTLIWGRHDRATPLAIGEAAQRRHGWPLRVIEDAGDDPAMEQPGPFVRALRAALADAAGLRRAGFRGEIVERGEKRYDELRAVFNGMVDRRPALLARCGDARDVAAAVRFARARRLPVSVYGGGHNVTGNAVCDDGVTIDLRPMKAIVIDPEARTCRVGAGLTWGELDAATQAHGLAVTGGRMSTTGLGGLIVGGGSGWIERKCGYAVDNLRSVELVTADGRILRASETENPDLFWGTRGGGGNLGVATEFELALHPIGPTVLGGILIHAADDAPRVLRGFADAMADAPDEVGAGIALLTAPPLDFVPAALHGQPVAGIVACYAGPPDEGADALRPLRALGSPVADLVGPMPYVALQQIIDEGYPAGMRNYWTGDFLTGLPDAAIEILCRFHRSVPSPLTQILVLPGGGAAARVPDGTMVITERGAPFNLHITSLWSDPADDERNIAWTRALGTAMKPFTTGRVYVNFIGDEGHDRVVASFGRDNYARLRALKDRYDPENLFASNQNVVPSRLSSARR
jgi:FAD/FMN-containing dehydrogenase/pimeloyl-ACP methyl ester carboxylesterase